MYRLKKALHDATPFLFLWIIYQRVYLKSLFFDIIRREYIGNVV